MSGTDPRAGRGGEPASALTAAQDDAPADDVLDSVDVLRGSPREIRPLLGGLTNRNYKVTTPAGCFVARISPKDTSALAIDREQEYRNSVIAARAGVGAEVVGYAPNHRLLVVRFIEGRTFTDASFSAPGTLHRVAEACRQLHDGAPFVNDFNMFDVQRRYLSIVQANGYRLPDGYLAFAPLVERVRTALEIHPSEVVPCNNDLLAGNFIDDGAKIWLIDYEYSGNNDACFELGNIWSECHLSNEQLEELITAYFGRPMRSKVARAKLQGLMSKYGWTLWASIQQAMSPIEFDFWSWGMEKYESAIRMFRGSDFERLLTEAQRTD